MKKELNLVEILKDCPKGTKLYSPICGECMFGEIKENSRYPVKVYFYREEDNDILIELTKTGQYFRENTGECILFPSKDNRDWSTFKIPKPKWNPDTLQPFTKVLVRDNEDDAFWFGDLFLYCDKTSDYTYVCMQSAYLCCIPYNEETAHLLGTNQAPPEYYRL